MSTRLKLALHSGNEDTPIVEIHHPTLGFIGAIYPTENGVKIVSKYFDPYHDANLVAIDPSFPPALIVKIV
jgi:hypothetical protein